MRWSFTDSEGTLHAVSWTDGQVLGDARGVGLIRYAIAAGEPVDAVGTRADVSTPERAWLTIDSTLRRWFEDVQGPHPDTVLTSPPERGVR